VGLFFFAVTLLTSEDGVAILTALLLTSLFVAVYWILQAYVPALWYAEQWIATSFSWWLGGGLRLGPTALGMPLLLLFGFQALSVYLLPGAHEPIPTNSDESGCHAAGWPRTLAFGAWLAASILAVAVYLWLQPVVVSWLGAWWPTLSSVGSSPQTPGSLTYLDSPWLLFLLLWLISALASLVLRPGGLQLRPDAKKGRWMAIGLGLLALGIVVLTLDPPSRPHRGTILFHDTGHLDWGRPAFGRYGPHSGGSFGLWPDYLAAYGYEAKIGSLSIENLAEADAVVLINLPQKLGPDENERLLSFVECGGGLIVWGEHTGVGRIREPINDLLAGLPGTPMHLRFDSAVPERQGWAEGLDLRPHPALYDVQNDYDLVMAVGASLDIQPPARPLIVGRFGHSDAGDVTNQALNYVGDMVYNRGERLGDLVLASYVKYGQGRIVLVGDTTPLGSVNLMTTMPFHVRLLDWLTSEPSRAWDSVLHNEWLAVVLMASAGACIIASRSRLALASAVVVLGLALVATGFLNASRSAPAPPAGPIAYVDAGHQERFDRLLWEETSIGGLAYNLVRNGTVPLLVYDLDAEALARADLLVIIAPGQRFSKRELETISRWVDRGGHLLITVGYEESQGSQDLLACFGLAVDHIPLGPAEVMREAGRVQFREAWPVRAEGGGAQVVAEAYEQSVALYQPWGNGGIALFGDSTFLLGGSLENEYSYNEGNILLLRDTLQQYMAVGNAP
jgi:hypothetical protein